VPHTWCYTVRGVAGGWPREGVSSGLHTAVQERFPTTEAENSGGRLQGISRAGAGPTEIFFVTEQRALFYEQILPAQLESSSRTSYWGTWQLVLSLGLAHGIMDQLLPMSLANLEALIMELMILGMAANSIKNMMACIQSRHRMSELTPPILQAKLFARIFKAVASTTGAP
jgi:hypothetical protein